MGIPSRCPWDAHEPPRHRNVTVNQTSDRQNMPEHILTVPFETKSHWIISCLRSIIRLVLVVVTTLRVTSSLRSVLPWTWHYIFDLGLDHGLDLVFCLCLGLNSTLNLTLTLTLSLTLNLTLTLTVILNLTLTLTWPCPWFWAWHGLWSWHWPCPCFHFDRDLGDAHVGHG